MVCLRDVLPPDWVRVLTQGMDDILADYSALKKAGVQRDGVMDFFPRLREKLRPERAHIVPEDFDWLFESDYEPKWSETFIER